jgi:hypothetical protein
MGRRVVGLETEAGQPDLLAAVGQFEVGDSPRGEVRRDVDVRVKAAPYELPSPLRRGRVTVSLPHDKNVINIVNNLCN